MSIITNRLSTGSLVIIVDDEESQEQFKQLINRGLNCWDRAPAELKEFGDMVTEGRVHQDYRAQEFVKPRSE